MCDNLIKAAVFDLDHTLFDRYGTIKKIIDTVDYSESPFKEDISGAEIFNAIKQAEKLYIYDSFNLIVNYLYENDMLRDDADLDNYYNKYIKPQYMKTAVNFPFTLPMLKELKKMGIRIGVITNGQPEIQLKKLELLGLDKAFEYILVGNDFGIGKPEPNIFNKMASLMDLAPNEILYVGDHPKNDVWGSYNAGYIPVWVKTIGTWNLTDFEKPDLQVDTIAEIPEIVKKLNNTQ